MASLPWHHRYKPAASAATRTLLAAVMWTLVGAALLFFGARWVIGSGMTILLAPAVLLGVLKTRLVLDPSAERAVERIRRAGDQRCAGGFFSWKTWLFIVAMSGAGRVLRDGLLPLPIVGLLYVAVGVALLLACRKLWRGWYVLRTAA